MPLKDGHLITPDDAMAQGLCPECAVDLRKVNPIAHRREHWKKVPNDDADGQEGLRRMRMLDNFIIENKVRTSDQPKPKDSPAPAAASTASDAPADETREAKIARLTAELAAAEGQGE